MRKMKIGVIGCGAISDIYLTNLTEHFENVEVVACSDISQEKAQEAMKDYGLARACTTEELLADKDIDIVLNLTIPDVHYKINKQILEARKHIYCEKPFALNVAEANEILELAEKMGLRVSSAPDTFLGSGIQSCRKIIDEGLLGDIVGFTANLNTPGPDCWHPNPGFYYMPGGGPMKDMGSYYLTALVSLIGPVESVYCAAQTTYKKRLIQGSYVDVSVPTHYTGILRMASGVAGNINMSFDVYHTELPKLEIYGTKGMLSVPDPNMNEDKARFFDGTAFNKKMAELDSPVERFFLLYGPEKTAFYQELPFAFEGWDNMRGIGVAEMADAIDKNRAHRASGRLATHVVDIESSLDESARLDRPIKLSTSCELPEPFYNSAKDIL